MKNKLTDLNNHLFAEIERLGDEETKGEDLREEILRAEAIAKISTQIVQNAAVVLKAYKFADDKMNADYDLPELLG